MKPVLKPELYDYFAILCVAIRLLLTPTEKNIDTAQILLENFVKDFTQIYAAHSVVYNLHALVHLPSEVRKHGSLELFSAFPFENFLGQIKSLIRGSKHVMQQIICRVQELNALIQPNDPPHYTLCYVNIMHMGLFQSELGMDLNSMLKSSWKTLFLIQKGTNV